MLKEPFVKPQLSRGKGQRSRQTRPLAFTQAKTRRPESSRRRKRCECSALGRLGPCQEGRAARLLALAFSWGLQPELAASPGREHPLQRAGLLVNECSPLRGNSQKHRDETDVHVWASRRRHRQAKQACSSNLWDCFHLKLCVHSADAPT